MRARNLTFAITALLAAGQALACQPLRLGYIDQHRPPYYMGPGSAEAAAPGASIDLVREIAASVGCKVVSVRLPVLRLRAALEAGQLDMIPMDTREGDGDRFALPKTKLGGLDRDRALRLYTIVFVRSADQLPKDTDPLSYFMSRSLGLNHGASLIVPLRAKGFSIDDGAVDAARNLEKLARKRIDGYALSLVGPGDMDSFVSATYGTQIKRLEKPLDVHSVWLGFNKSYYERNPQQVEAMWTWIGTHGHARFSELVKKYEAQR